MVFTFLGRNRKVNEVVKKHRAKRIRWTVILAALLLVLAGVVLWFHENLSYDFDVMTCKSDNLFVVKDSMTEYMNAHEGQIPQTE